jgi:hypothetical protein
MIVRTVYTIAVKPADQQKALTHNPRLPTTYRLRSLRAAHDRSADLIHAGIAHYIGVETTEVSNRIIARIDHGDTIADAHRMTAASVS